MSKLRFRSRWPRWPPSWIFLRLVHTYRKNSNKTVRGQHDRPERSRQDCHFWARPCSAERQKPSGENVCGKWLKRKMTGSSGQASHWSWTWLDHEWREKLTKQYIIINMILRPLFSIFPCSPLLSWTCWTPGLSIPWGCLPTSSSRSSTPNSKHLTNPLHNEKFVQFSTFDHWYCPCYLSSLCDITFFRPSCLCFVFVFIIDLSFEDYHVTSSPVNTKVSDLIMCLMTSSYCVPRGELCCFCRSLISDFAKVDCFIQWVDTKWSLTTACSPDPRDEPPPAIMLRGEVETDNNLQK